MVNIYSGTVCDVPLQITCIDAGNRYCTLDRFWKGGKFVLSVGSEHEDVKIRCGEF